MRGRRAAKGIEARKVVAYVRVSTDEQAGEGVSLPAQEERLRAYGVATGHAVAEVIVDAGVSAKSLARPGMQQILNGLRSRKVGVVIVVNLDRLTRSVATLPICSSVRGVGGCADLRVRIAGHVNSCGAAHAQSACVDQPMGARGHR